MKARVTAQVPLDKFKSEWEDRDYAAECFGRYVEDIWSNDLNTLITAGLEVSVKVDVAPKPALFFPEVHIEPYSKESFDMMQKTRELLATEKELWNNFCNLPKVNALYDG